MKVVAACGDIVCDRSKVLDWLTHHELLSSSVPRSMDGGVDELRVPRLEPKLSPAVVGTPLV
jgi:hypothetical protein